jgi:hypothetical protein
MGSRQKKKEKREHLWAQDNKKEGNASQLNLWDFVFGTLFGLVLNLALTT